MQELIGSMGIFGILACIIILVLLFFAPLGIWSQCSKQVTEQKLTNLHLKSIIEELKRL